MRNIMIGIAAIALIAGPAGAQGNGGGGGKGNGGGGGGGAAAQASPGKGNGGGGGGGMDHSQHGGGNAGGKAQAERSNGGNGNGGGSAPARVQQAEPGRGHGNGNTRAAGPDERDARGTGQAKQRAAASNGNGNAGANGNRNGNDNVDPRTITLDDRGRNERTMVVDRQDGRGGDWRQTLSLNSGRVIDGCPPGLAKKSPACVPPGQARESGWYNTGDYRPDWWGLSGYNDGRYYYDDGYLLRLGDGGRIGGYIPLLGGALGIGNAWPSYYQPTPLPSYYESYYGLGPSNGYRYADDVIYQVDPGTSAITSIAALLTGDQFAVGQRMPLGYDAYNVPYSYRDQYYDSPDSLYRYSDGYVYQVDPTTQLVQAAIQLLVS